MHDRLEQRSFLAALVLVSLAFAWLLAPFLAAIFWAALIAILFWPLRCWLTNRLPGWSNLVSLLAVTACVVIVIVPLSLIFASLVQQAATVYQKVDSGQINLAHYIEQVKDAFPMLQSLLERFHVDLDSLKHDAAAAAVSGSRYLATQAVAIGQNTFQIGIGFVLMLYLAFFFLRDGESLVQLMIRALPLGDDRERLLFAKFAEVSRATVKGNLVVAMAQGALGGLIFWILGIQGALFWGVVMTVMSLLPAVGAAIIWAPVAVWLFASGDIWRGAVLAVFGVAVVGLVDNALRPVLVGRDTKLPDYLVLLSTLGGLGLFGLSGFVIGPLIAALFMAFWDIFIREFNAPADGSSETSE